MNPNDKRIINRYIREIRHLLPTVRQSEKTFLADIRQSIDDYYETAGIISFETLTSEFGEPKDLVSNYILAKDAEILRKELNFSKYIKYTFCIAAVAIMLLAGFKGYTIYLVYQKAQATQIDHEVIIIEEAETNEGY